MRITDIRELSVRLQGNIANAVVDFSSHTVSLVALVSDQVRNGKPVIGIAFNSIGRFAQGGILRDRILPRLREAKTSTLLTRDEARFDPAAIAHMAMRDEKPGGHGDRASAIAAVELAAWDLNAKLADEPAYVHIAKILNVPPAREGTPVYAAGGYYYPDQSTTRLQDELAGYLEQGYTAFKIKIGGATLQADLERIECAIRVAQNSTQVAVDANGRFALGAARRYGDALSTYSLRWYEEPVDPLDYQALSQLAEGYSGAIATGENLFSAIDTKNLVRYGGLRADRDVLQMDPGLAYGLTEYLEILDAAKAAGFSLEQCIPHGGHLINLHIAAALGLGGCEAYPDVFQPFGGYSPQCTLAEGIISPSDAPGFGLEQKPELAVLIDRLTEN